MEKGGRGRVGEKGRGGERVRGVEKEKGERRWGRRGEREG